MCTSRINIFSSMPCLKKCFYHVTIFRKILENVLQYYVNEPKGNMLSEEQGIQCKKKVRGIPRKMVKGDPRTTVVQ